MVGNTRLVNYGILTEESTHRAHVCFVTNCVYIFETKQAQKQLSKVEYRKLPVYTSGVVTAEGYLVPPEDIPGCRRVDIPESLFYLTSEITEKSTTGKKGDVAAEIVKQLIIANKFPFFSGIPELVDDCTLQVKGVDISVVFDIQVKCDWRGGPKELGGTGNLFLQVAECNPFRQYTEEKQQAW